MPRYRRPGCCRRDRHLAGEERVRRRRAPAAGTPRGPRSNSARAPARPRASSVAVEATTFGPDRVRPSTVRQAQSSSTAVSYRPTMVPSGPVIRCSSSWMIRSGGRSRSTGLTASRRPGRRSLCRCPQPVRCVQCRGAVAVPRALLASPGRTAMPATPFHGIWANLSTVAMSRQGSSR